MKKGIVLLFFIGCSLLTFAQQTLSGVVVNEQGAAVEFGTVALLKPTDSTLAFFGITNQTGAFEIKAVTGGNYVLQISFIGYQTYDTIVTIPHLPSGNLGIYVLRTANVGLDEVTINAEKIPIQMLGDTIQYNANSFKTHPDASAEDLLEQLPGIDVDQNGNIKAQGEDVGKVLVDGKEFFSNDPTVATKNLPADAIEKVQVFDKSSDEVEFTGIEDGSQTKTINLVLKEGKKSMWLGDAKAGGGTENTYQANAKLYRFTKSDQIAFLGMLNNVNQFGFSFSDYIDFNGGIGNMMRGGGFRIETEESELPIDFGQTINGLITSGAAGGNYTHEVVPGNRFNISYLGNGYEKYLTNDVFSENFTPDFDYISDENSEETTENYYHRLNFNFKNKPDSMQSVFANGGLSFNYGKSNGSGYTSNYLNDILTNALTSSSFDNSDNISGNLNASYIHKFTGNWKYIKVATASSYKTTLTEAEWTNLSQYFDTGTELEEHVFQDEKNNNAIVNLDLISLVKISKTLYLEPAILLGMNNEYYNRSKGNLLIGAEEIDSISPTFTRNNYFIQPKLSLKKSTKKTQFKLGLGAEYLSMQNTLYDAAYPQTTGIYLLPEMFFEKEIKSGRRFGLNYFSAVNTPTATQLLPVPDDINPLSVYIGNPFLKPEYSHNLFGHFMFFDQFSFTSLFTSFQLSYVHDKINFSKTIHPDLTETYTMVNVDHDVSATIGTDFNTPIRPLKINLTIDLSETYNNGTNFVNDQENTINAFTHKIGLSIDNRKKEIVNASLGGNLRFTQTNYSIETGQQSNYVTNSVYLDLSVTPDSLWRFAFNGEISEYRVSGFEESTIVPLLTAEVSRYILPSNRGTITLKAYDLLNKNTGISQSGAYNYLMRQQSNTIGRYFMLSFKYRINKAEQASTVDVIVN
jgi:hypothetical protein